MPTKQGPNFIRKFIETSKALYTSKVILSFTLSLSKLNNLKTILVNKISPRCLQLSSGLRKSDYQDERQAKKGGGENNLLQTHIFAFMLRTRAGVTLSTVTDSHKMKWS